MTVDNRQDILDSRDIIERLDELRDLRETYQYRKDAHATALAEIALAPDEAGEALDKAEKDLEDAAYDWEQYAQDEFAELSALNDEGEGIPGWAEGESLIRDSYFETYAQGYAEEIGFNPLGWPARCIDWKQAAEELLQDYTSLEFGDVTYWVRS